MDKYSLSGNELERIYEQYIDMVYRICYMLLMSCAEAEDAAQNVFIKLMNAKNKPTGEEHLKAWLIVSAKNECKNTLKHWWRSKRVALEDIKEQGEYMKESENEVSRSVSQLPEKYRLPVYLHYYEGYSTDEIAKMLDVNASTLRTRLVQARKMLKLILEKEGFGNV